MTRYAHYVGADNKPGFAEIRGDLLVPLEGIHALDSNTAVDRIGSAPRKERTAVGLQEVRLLPASTNPRKVLCVGLNYAAHVKETKRDRPAYPVLFPKFASNLIGPTEDIVLPSESLEPDYEGELAVIIGRPGRRIREVDAYNHVLGYSVANDVSMRDYQYKSHQWLQGKAWDCSTPLGPYIVTPDEVELNSTRIRTTLNGEVMQEGDLSQLIFSIPNLISTISEFTMLEPGDVILTGTPSGIGHKRDPKVILRHGDVVSVEVGGVGRIENKVVAESA